MKGSGYSVRVYVLKRLVKLSWVNHRFTLED